MDRRIVLTYFFLLALAISCAAQRDTTYYLFRNGVARAFTFQKLTSAKESAALSYYPAFAMDASRFRYIRLLLEKYVALEHEYDSALRLNKFRDSLLTVYEARLKDVTASHEARAANFETSYRALVVTNTQSITALDRCEATIRAQRRAYTRRIISYSVVGIAVGVIAGVLGTGD